MYYSQNVARLTSFQNIYKVAYNYFPIVQFDEVSKKMIFEKLLFFHFSEKIRKSFTQNVYIYKRYFKN